MFTGVNGFAQRLPASKVPATVISTFGKNFPGIKDAKWEKEKGHYEADFKQGDKPMAALFDANGALLETETGIEVSALPLQVKDYLSANYKGSKVKEAAKLVLANGETNYEAEVKGIDLIFDANGRFIRKEKG